MLYHYLNVYFNLGLLSPNAPGAADDAVFRSSLAALTAFVVSLFLGTKLIEKFKEYKVSEDVSKTPSDVIRKLHAGKRGTPTMGGIVILLSVFISTGLWCDLADYSIKVLLFAAIGFGIIGFADDYIKLMDSHASGLKDRTKLFMQLVIGLFLGIALYKHFNGLDVGTQITLPVLKDIVLELGWFYVVLVMLYVAWTSNAVNITDGLDGLAIGCTIMTSLAFCVVAYVVSDWETSRFFGVQYVPGTEELTVFCAALAGSGLGFLWYNGFPAQAFMGDIGSLSVGGVLALVALLTKQEVLLVLIGMVFMVEAMSVFIQIAVFKMSGRRVFRCAPLHHHFQFVGWPETKITVRFWILTAVMSVLGLLVFRI
ncbi:MAG TPA: phospho-N-acetylmuramoyl-pentapeptide-transferase [Candidatus Avalokitesvara rifleensis]|uniref:phospho-N-acetylmuramoyl-pentapeptide- transferase n=1 Tax=Candidatus Avalokitesvara rifleensis TaxID=3367620 RepID=UPI002712570A|nr:phospho-N-acetylmuramoyl-pentapeptide-transferase [Candidatus Brocadiales bacterium]